MRVCFTVYRQIQLILCNIRILSAAIACGFFPMTFSTVFYIYLLNLVVWWLTKVSVYTLITEKVPVFKESAMSRISIIYAIIKL